MCTGNKHSTESGVWDVRVGLEEPVSKRVRREVLPDPEGPIRRMVGRVWEVLEVVRRM